ncbi:ligand-binding sensor domain-containing diguanylate cyclase [Xanthomonas sp. MUS 060]|uniref:ligand-binding sensor domain-containing diguanylate cyclase n=1 Tax=Xanthomonas sp. MUS 060 TaxID=1588031 RepID=UPI0005F2DC2C|nr:ligand-binding sensor domain-containing diguanylate cyclase [Xanthomonas sp. MUS 060]
MHTLSRLRLLWLCLLLGSGLSDAAHAQTIPLRRYGQDQGLLGLAGTCLLQRHGGSMWVCTESGLYSFHGHDFQQVPLQGQLGLYVIDAIEDAQQHVWVTTFDAVFVSDGTQLRRLTPEQTGPLLKNRLRLANTSWGTIVLNGKQVLRAVTDQNGDWQLRPLFNTATLARLPQLAEVHDVQGEADSLWLGCAKALCRVHADGSVTLYGQSHGLPPAQWRSIVHDRNGNLWVLGDRNVMRLPAGASQFQEQTPPTLDGPERVMMRTQILLDPQGRVLVPTGQGLTRWEDGHWRNFDLRNGLPDSSIVALSFDQAGDLWMSMDGEGVLRWNGYGWIENWDTSQGMSKAPTWSIQRSRSGELLLGNEGGMNHQLSNGRFQPWLEDAGTQVVSIGRAADGSLWCIDSPGQLRHYDPQGQLLRVYPRVGHTANRLYLDTAGRIWILTLDGIYMLDSAHSDAVPQRIQALPGGEYSDIQQRKDGSILIAGVAGLFQLRGTVWTPIKLLLDGKPTDAQLSKLLVQDDGSVWATLYAPGLHQGRFDGGTLTLSQKTAHLQTLQVYAIRRTRNGWVWIGHNQGIDVFNGHAWSRLTQTQGLLWNDISDSALFEDADGSMWIGTSRGVSHILDPRRLFDAQRPRLTLNKFSRDDKPITAGTRLSWSEEPLHIELGSPDLYDDRNRISIRYRFQGENARWIHTPNLEIEQPPLEPGDYVLEVQLFDAYRHTASAPLRVAFSVAPVWWCSQPMLGLYLLLGGALVVAALHWRERRMRQHQRELAELVARRTEELERDKHELELARSALLVKASHDALTGLLNRAGILETLTAQMRYSDATCNPLAVAMIDLDHFKRINDNHGHLVGDAVLIEVAQRLSTNLRDDDRIGRYGGEELLSVLPGLPPPSHERLESLRRVIGEQPLHLDEHQLSITASIGVAWYRPGESLEQMLARADKALYQAKRLGRDRVELQPA